MELVNQMWTIFAELGALIAEIAGGEKWPNYFPLKKALNKPGAWLLGVLIVLLGGGAIHLVYRLVPFLSRHLERTIMIASFLAMAGIICVSVIREFFFDMIAPAGARGELNVLLTPVYNFLNAYPLGWATTIPPLFFMILVWFACSYNVGTRSHLAFSEFRMNLPRPAQFACLTLDMVLWLAFSVIFIVGGMRAVYLSVANEAPVDGSDYNLMLWWFTILVPISFVLLSARAIGVWVEDLARYRGGEPLVGTFKIGGDN